MHIYCEDSLLYAREYFAGWGELHFFSGRNLDPQSLTNADILLVRSTTKVDERLLSHCPNLKYVGTATAGTNHMDLAALEARGIAYGSAAGCNAIAVAEYVISSLFVLAQQQGWQLKDKQVGIVGAGHVGSQLDAKLKAIGVNTLLCDPPLQAQGDKRPMVDIDAIMACDIISLHVPLVEDGAHPTRLLFDKHRLNALTDQQVLINACRGEVLDNQALLSLYQQGRQFTTVLDVWENEPDILTELLPYVALTSAHIAGHTLEGKARGTWMLYQQVAELFDLPCELSLNSVLPASEFAPVSLASLEQQHVANMVLSVYDIRRDDQQFRTLVNKPGGFEYIRRHYAIRREFAALQVSAGNSAVKKAICGLGFSPKPDTL
ncbi:4-phosphoerythronate dehydrogenase [Bowmanella yangjiangensis]|uniref:Erythronate-4-phosphate dehydrogenase n=1 Tax=Bowmanella yangjiangensis TaxID=2811230 RepID=A0ABS3CPE5_9ALTE|nr:4-phosphoerythronate dehydrogenase [Bowmanella yangjiangensis]MBN7818959.1 4-phosphoerythronate dehydrogenase [Bowmanella yangjiangensis]